jgi:hypothetical protein
MGCRGHLGPLHPRRAGPVGPPPRRAPSPPGCFRGHLGRAAARPEGGVGGQRRQAAGRQGAGRGPATPPQVSGRERRRPSPRRPVAPEGLVDLPDVLQPRPARRAADLDVAQPLRHQRPEGARPDRHAAAERDLSPARPGPVRRVASGDGTRPGPARLAGRAPQPKGAPQREPGAGADGVVHARHRSLHRNGREGVRARPHRLGGGRGRCARRSGASRRRGQDRPRPQGPLEERRPGPHPSRPPRDLPAPGLAAVRTLHGRGCDERRSDRCPGRRPPRARPGRRLGGGDRASLAAVLRREEPGEPGPGPGGVRRRRSAGPGAVRPASPKHPARRVGGAHGPGVVLPAQRRGLVRRPGLAHHAADRRAGQLRDRLGRGEADGTPQPPRRGFPGGAARPRSGCGWRSHLLRGPADGRPRRCRLGQTSGRKAALPDRPRAGVRRGRRRPPDVSPTSRSSAGRSTPTANGPPRPSPTWRRTWPSKCSARATRRGR